MVFERREESIGTHDSENEFDVRQEDSHDERDDDDDDRDDVEAEGRNEVRDHVGVRAATLKTF